MANVKKETTTTTKPKATTTNPKVTATAKSVKETELENQIKELQDMMLSMQKLVAQTQAVKNIPKEEYGEIVAPINEIEEQVPFRQYIRVMSLTPHHLTLSTEGFGNGTVYNFVNYGQIQSILYEDLAKIIHNNPRFAREGYFYIMDERVIRIHNMVDDYNKILKKEQIDNILNLDANIIRDLLRKSSQHIKNTVSQIVLAKLIAGEDIDLNKIRVISVESGKDIDAIMKRTEELNNTEYEE